MQYERYKDGVAITGADSFDINDTLLCGQVFRFEQTSDNAYFIIAGERGVNIKQDGDTFFISPCDIPTFENVWLDYFDLKRDYIKIKENLAANDSVMERAIGFGGGIRILNQDRFETLLSFIISQNKQIAGIKKIIGDMARAYGKDMGGYYAFPDAATLSRLSVSDFAALKTGFRARYLADAVRKVYTNAVKLYPAPGTPTQAIRDGLMKIDGVGPKVANCALLFSFGRRESFPIDVWVLRALEKLYFNGKKISLQEAGAFALEKFGEYGGYAQQYLFYYMRSGGM